MLTAFKLGLLSRRKAAVALLPPFAAAAALYLFAVTPSPAEENSFDPIKGIKNLFSGEKYETKIEPDIPPGDLYNQALAKLDSKDYAGAAKKFEELDKQYPYSQWQRKAMLMTAFSQYQNGSYDEAVAAAKRYIARFPSGPETDYAYYLEAMSYYNQIPEISRDQERAAKAVEVFSLIIEKFPQSEYAADARYKLQVARDQLAGKEMLVGRYYLEQHDYGAAINRFRQVLFKYQTTRHAEEALMRLTEAYLALGITSEAQTAAAVLGHNFPESQWYKDAFALLKEGGLKPHEDEGSWISKAFRKMSLG